MTENKNPRRRPQTLRRLAAAAGLLIAVSANLPAQVAPAVEAPLVDSYPMIGGPTSPFFVEESVSGIGQLEQLAVDIARRTLLAHKPHLAKDPIYTVTSEVRIEGDIIHTYARLRIPDDDDDDDDDDDMELPFEAEVFSSLVYTRGFRRMMDLSYRDNCATPTRICRRTADVVSAYNTEFERRDPLQMSMPPLGDHVKTLVPRKRRWIWNPFQGDHGWHIFNADGRGRDGWIP